MAPLSDEDKVIIRHYIEKEYTAYEIWKQNPEKNWHYSKVKRAVKKFKEYGTMDRKKGSGRPRSARTAENEAFVEEMICSQEEEPGTHASPREIARELEISHSSVRRIVEDKGYNQFKRLKTPQMNDATRNRRVDRAVSLHEKFAKNPRMIERTIFQDESDFPLQVPLNSQNDRVYHKGTKKDVPDENLFHESNRQSVKVMVSAALTWHGVTRPIFVKRKGLKVNAKNYKNHLKRELFPAIEKIYPRRDWIFIQDGASSHTSNIVQDFLQETIPRRYLRKDQWPPKSPDSNPLDYYFWNEVKRKVYRGRLKKPFETEEEIISKIKSVWKECARNLPEIRKSMKQFVGRVRTVGECNGSSIKMHYS